MDLILDNVLIDADGVFLGCEFHANEAVYVIKNNDDIEYDAGVSFVLSDSDIWYNIEDGFTLSTKDEREIVVQEHLDKNTINEDVSRYYLYLDGTKTPLHKKRTIKGAEVISVTGDVMSTRDIEYLVSSYFRHERFSLEVL